MYYRERINMTSRNKICPFLVTPEGPVSAGGEALRCLEAECAAYCDGGCSLINGLLLIANNLAVVARAAESLVRSTQVRVVLTANRKKRRTSAA